LAKRENIYLGNFIRYSVYAHQDTNPFHYYKLTVPFSVFMLKQYKKRSIFAFKTGIIFQNSAAHERK